MKETICIFCGKEIRASGKNLAICVDCDKELSNEEKLEYIQFYHKCLYK